MVFLRLTSEVVLWLLHEHIHIYKFTGTHVYSYTQVYTHNMLNLNHIANIKHERSPCIIKQTTVCITQLTSSDIAEDCHHGCNLSPNRWLSRCSLVEERSGELGRFSLIFSPMLCRQTHIRSLAKSWSSRNLFQVGAVWKQMGIH